MYFHSPTKVCTTVMRLVVRVPVLSEQMAVALPIVSHASRWRTRLLSFIIFYSFHNDQAHARKKQVGKKSLASRKVNLMVTSEIHLSVCLNKMHLFSLSSARITELITTEADRWTQNRAVTKALNAKGCSNVVETNM